MNITDLYIQLFGKNHIKDGDVIALAEHGRVGGTSLGQGLKYVAPIDPATGKSYDTYATKVTSSGSLFYVAIAAPGSAQADSVWQAQQIDTSDPANILVLWADTGNFSQVATDLTALTYT
jgi:hypothetical protein